MKNPWILLGKKPPFILDVDREAIENFNRTRRKQSHRIRSESSLPEPFIGDPRTASVILLNLNPGHKPMDQQWHKDKAFRKALTQNLRLGRASYPFYPLNPNFGNSPVGRWWRRSLGQLRKTFSDEHLAKNILAVEWFPYHSRRGSLAYFERSPLTSQGFSWWLAKQALENPKKVVVVGKGFRKWENSLKSLRGVIRLKNARGWCYITSRNMRRNEFARILEALAS